MMSGSFRSVVTATAAAGIGVTTFTPRPLFEITVAAIAVVIALGWVPLLPIQMRRTPVTVVLLLTALASAFFVRETAAIAVLAPILALTLVGIFISQLLRRDDREGLVDQVAGVFTGATIVAAAAGWLAVDPGPGGAALTLSAAVCLAASATVTALPFRVRLSMIFTVVVATCSGLGLGYGLGDLTLLSGTLIGLVAGLVVAAVHYLFQEYSDSGTALSSLAGALIAVAVSGVPVYILGRVLLHMP